MKIRKHNENEYRINSSVKGIHEVDLFQMFNVAIMDTFGLTSEEYNLFCEKVSDEELNVIFLVFDGQDVSFTAKRKALEIVNKYKNLANEDSE